MTYAAYEMSLDSGAPIELYEFVQGAVTWRFISGATELVRFGHTYVPSSITRDNVKQTTDTFKDSIRLTFPRDNPFSSQYIAFAPEDVTTVTIYRGHFGDADEQFIVYWKGRVVGAKTSGNQVDIQCESVFTSIKRPGLRARFEYGCRRTLYLKGCNVNRELYKLIGSILSVTGGLTLTIVGASSQPDGFYTGGMLITADGIPRFVVAHSGDSVTLSRTVPGLASGQNISLYPGCDHLKETCFNKFNNLNNFGGFPWIPIRNPYNGSSIS